MRMVPQAREALQASVAGGSVSALREPESRQSLTRIPAPQEQQPQVEQEQEPTDEEPVNDPASSGLEWSSDKHLPTSDELIELSKEQQEAILGGSGDLSFNMSPWIRALVSIVYDFNEGLPQYCAEQVLVLSNCVPAEFQQTLQRQTTKQGTSWREFICSLQKTTPVTKNPVLLKFRGKRGGAVKPSSKSNLYARMRGFRTASFGSCARWLTAKRCWPSAWFPLLPGSSTTRPYYCGYRLCETTRQIIDIHVSAVDSLKLAQAKSRKQ